MTTEMTSKSVLTGFGSDPTKSRICGSYW